MDLVAEGKRTRKKGYLINKARTDVLRWSEMGREIRPGQTDGTVTFV